MSLVLFFKNVKLLQISYYSYVVKRGTLRFVLAFKHVHPFRLYTFRAPFHASSSFTARPFFSSCSVDRLCRVLLYAAHVDHSMKLNTYDVATLAWSAVFASACSIVLHVDSVSLGLLRSSKPMDYRLSCLALPLGLSLPCCIAEGYA